MVYTCFDYDRLRVATHPQEIDNMQSTVFLNERKTREGIFCVTFDDFVSEYCTANSVYQVEKFCRRMVCSMDELYSNDTQPSDDFVKDVEALVFDWVNAQDGGMRIMCSYEYSFMRAQLCVLVKHPGFIKTELFLSVVHILSKLHSSRIWRPCMYTVFGFSDGASTRVLRDGITIEHVNIFATLIHSDFLWDAKDRDITLLFEDIAQVLAILSADYFKETLAARIELLKRTKERLSHPTKDRELYADIEQCIIATLPA